MSYRALISVTRCTVLVLLLGVAFATTMAAAAPVPVTTDMAVTVSDSPDPVTAGQNLDYTIVVTNNGPNAADVTLADTLPAGTTFTSLDTTAGFTCTTPGVGSGGTVSCSKASLAVGASATFTLRVLVSSGVTDGSVLSDTATVSTSAGDDTPSNDSDTATTTVDTNADVGVSMSDSPDPVAPGNAITYTIEVSNTGPSDAASVSWTDALPLQTTFLQLSQDSGPPMSCTSPSIGSNGTVSCDIQSLPAGATASFSLVVQVDPTVNGGTITNTVSASSPTPDYSETSNNSATTTTDVLTSADLSVTNTDSPDPVEAGSDITYTITVTNSGPGTVGNAVLTDDVPSGTTFVSMTGPQDCITPELGSTGQIECNLPTLASGATATYTLTVHVLESQDNGSTITDTATVDSASNVDPNSGNDSAQATTTVHTSADLAVSSSDSPDPVLAGQDVTYTIDVANNGPAAARGVTLADTLPPGTSFVSVSAPAGFSCTTPAVGANGTVTCSGGTIDYPGPGVSFTLVVRVSPSTPAGTVLSNTATASASTPEANAGDESSTSTTTVATSADLAASIDDAPDPVIPGGDLTYTIGLENKGPSDASTVSLTDTLPPGTTFKSLTAPGGFSCTTPAVGSAGTVSCSAASVAAGAKPSITLVLKVDDSVPAGTTLTNTVNSSTATADPSPANGSASTTTTVQPSADVAVTSSGSPDPVVAGTNLSYTLGLSDNGPSPASDVSLNDDLPAGTTFVSLSAPAGFSCATPAVGAGGNVKCTSGALASGASAMFTLVVRVDPDRPSGSTLSNTATASRAEPDPNSANDSAKTGTTVGTSADLSTSVSDSPDPVVAGSVVTYHARIHNDGPSNADRPRLAMPIPSETTLVGAAQVDGSAFRCTSDGMTVSCDADSLAAGASAGIDVAVRTGRGQHGTITARPVASAATGDPDSSNDASSETTQITAAPPRPNRLTIGRTVGKRRSGVIVVALACRSFAGDSCSTTVTVTFKRPHGDLGSITRRATVPSGRRTIVYVIAPRSERRRIKRIPRLPVRVTATNPPERHVVRDTVIIGP